MFKIVIFLIFAKIFITSCVNFCEIENKYCGVEKHVACDINVTIYSNFMLLFIVCRGELGWASECFAYMIPKMKTNEVDLFLWH